jgi:VIT1/CCC1 family predicted Fe2+/Mn2+ transporter
MFEYQIGLERDELREYPEEEAEELALIYQARGMQIEEARRVSLELVKNEASALDALAGGLRMVLIGAGAGAATWLIGRALGAAIS